MQQRILPLTLIVTFVILGATLARILQCLRLVWAFIASLLAEAALPEATSTFGFADFLDRFLKNLV